VSGAGDAIRFQAAGAPNGRMTGLSLLVQAKRIVARCYRTHVLVLAVTVEQEKT
jgi:hypothetical protein